MKLVEICSKSKEIHILWYPSKLCNFDCSYCHDALHDRSSPLILEADFSLALQNFSKLPEGPVSLSISGGEPFLDQDLHNKMKALKAERGERLKIGVTTNGSLPGNTMNARFLIWMP